MISSHPPSPWNAPCWPPKLESGIFWDSSAPDCGSFDQFATERRRVFDQALVGRSVACQLLGLHQESKVQYDVFLNNSCHAICLWTSTVSLTSSSMWTCECRRDGRRDCHPASQTMSGIPCFLTLLNCSMPEPMQINHTNLIPQEKQRSLGEQLCFYCGGTGHTISCCPKTTPTTSWWILTCYL